MMTDDYRKRNSLSSIRRLLRLNRHLSTTQIQPILRILRTPERQNQGITQTTSPSVAIGSSTNLNEMSGLIPSTDTHRLQRVETSSPSFTIQPGTTSPEYVTIGSVSVPLPSTSTLNTNTTFYLDEISSSQQSLRHLQFLMKKIDILKQDVCLIGSPPSPYLRRLALAYCELTRKSYEYVRFDRDTTESDLKQRRNIVNKTVQFSDSCAVKAALKGSILILDGLEKAERNVLPALNNLLENREMQLEDGRFLVSPSRYDDLNIKYGKARLSSWNLVRCHENFRVLALTLPVPPHFGSPMDPPLRSRFQALGIRGEDLVSSSSSLSYCRTPWEVDLVSKLQSETYSSYALSFLLRESIRNDEEEDIIVPSLTSLKRVSSTTLSLTFSLSDHNVVSYSSVPCGLGMVGTSPSPSLTLTPTQNQSLIKLLHASCAHSHVALIGPSSSGKSEIARRYARTLGYYPYTIVSAYKEMTSFDLFYGKRGTLSNGDTTYLTTTLVDAATRPGLLVLDSAQLLHPSTITSLHRLLTDGEINYLPSSSSSSSTRIKIHPSFRVLVLVTTTPKHKKKKWLNEEIKSMFLWVRTPSPTNSEIVSVLMKRVPDLPRATALSLCKLRESLNQEDSYSLYVRLTLRELIRISRRSLYESSLSMLIYQSCLAQFMGPFVRERLDLALQEAGITSTLSSNHNSIAPPLIRDDHLILDNMSIKLSPSTNPLLVPKTRFHDNPSHTRVLALMLRDWLAGEHLMLIGNQGVGKNKLTDRFLELLRLPREYVQLHRDSTVAQLTSVPTIKNGIIIYEDSPLVRAVRLGHVLVVDEADKAPAHVTSLLKTLASEDRQMQLSDGRRIGPINNNKNTIPVHKNFRMIILGNRPGYPFQGNDFLYFLGGTFATFDIGHPDVDSEQKILKSYAPDLNEQSLLRLQRVFQDLRELEEDLSYPYSTRELVAVIRHLDRFPRDGITGALRSVFDFEQWNEGSVDLVRKVLRRHGIAEYVEGVRVGRVLELKISEQKEEPISFGAWFAALVRVLPASKTNNNVATTTTTTSPGWNATGHSDRAQVFTEAFYHFPCMYRGEVGVSCATRISKQVVAVLVVVAGSRVPRLKLYSEEQTLIVDLNHSDPKSFGRIVRPEDFQMTLIGESSTLCILDVVTGLVRLINLIEGRKIELTREIQLEKGSRLVPGSSSNLESIGALTYFESTAKMILSDGRVATFAFPREIVSCIPRDENIYSVNFENSCGELKVTMRGDGEIRGDLRLASNSSWRLKVMSTSSPWRLASVYPDRVERVRFTTSNEREWTRQRVYTDKEDTWRRNRRPGNAIVMSTGQLVVAWEGDEDDVLEITNLKRGLRRIVTCAARDMMPKTETANTTFGFTISGSRRQTFPRLDLVDMEDHLLVMDKDNGRITFYDVDTEAIHREMREWAERVGRRGGGDDGELKIVRGREQKGKGQGRGKGQGKGKGQGRGKGEGKGQGSGKGEGKGRGSGKGEGTRKGLSPNDIDLNLPIPTSIIEQEQNLVQETNSSSQRKKQTGKDPSVFRSKWNALQRRIESLPTDLETYNLYRQNVSRHTRILKQVLLSAEAKKRERDWIRYREDGELDDSRLVEGLTGEKNIYRRRGRNESNSNSEQQKPKRLRFVFDLSMSMGRYDSTDGRLRRSLETAVMIMEAFRGISPGKYQWSIVGHSGDTDRAMIVEEKIPPRSDEKRLEALRKMNGHVQLTDSGDNTLEAGLRAVKEISKLEADERVVFLLSDANLEAYGIGGKDLDKLIKTGQDLDVRVFVMFIGTLGDQAVRLVKESGSGRAGRIMIAMRTEDIPKLVKRCLMMVV